MSWLRRVALIALGIVPIAVFANVARVAILVLITLNMGYDAGQSFLHEAAGLVMFAVALACVFALEGATRKVARGAARTATTHNGAVPA